MRPSAAPRALAACAALVALLGPPACVSFQLGQTRVNQQPREEAALELVPGRTTLEECLLALGSPVEITQLGEGAVLTWAWEDEEQFSVRVSFPLSRQVNGFVQYADIDAMRNHLQVEFDGSWTLVRVSAGNGSPTAENHADAHP